MLNDIGSRVLLSEEEIDQMTDEDGNLWILGLEDPVAFNTQEEETKSGSLRMLQILPYHRLDDLMAG